MGLITAAAAIGTAALGAASASAQSKAAKKAANAQVAAADRATELQRETYYDQRALLAPSITAGASARARQMLMQGYSPDEVKRFLMSTSAAVNAPAAGQPGVQGPRGGGYMDGEGQWQGFDGQTIDAQPGEDYSWVDSYDWAPQSPSYQWRFDEGQRALERSKAAGGDFFSGDTAMALTRYGQDYASNEYQNAFNRLGVISGAGQTATGALSTAATNYGQNFNFTEGNAEQATGAVMLLATMGWTAFDAWRNSRSRKAAKLLNAGETNEAKMVAAGQKSK